METMTEATTDKRVDELSKRVDFGFDQVDKRMGGFAREVDHRFDRVDDQMREFRAEIRDLRSEMKSGDDSLRAEIKAGDDALRVEMREGFAAVNASIEGIRRLLFYFLTGILGSAVAGIIVALVAPRV